MNAFEHLETHLGQMERGWGSDSFPGVQICLFRNQPAPGVSTVSTLGLSDAVLPMGHERHVRQELLLSIHGERPPDELAKLLFHVAERLVRARRALLRGDVLPLGSAIANDSLADSLYATNPCFFLDELATLYDTSPPTVFVWLVPLLPSEAALVRVSGWSAFEDLLESRDVDLFDLGWPGVV